MLELSDLTARIVTLVTLEAFLIFVGLLMLDESIALMEHRITITTLPALLNIGMLLTEVHTCNRQKLKHVNFNTPQVRSKLSLLLKKEKKEKKL